MNTQRFQAAALMPALVLAMSVAQAAQPAIDSQPTHVVVDASTQASRTAKVIDRFNQAFVQHDGSLLEGLVAEDCVMESVEGNRVVGRAANLRLWQNLASSRDGEFAVEDVVVFGERATIRWRYRSGPGLSQSVRGVTLMRLHDGLISEAIAYSKSGDSGVAQAVRNASSLESR